MNANDIPPAVIVTAPPCQPLSYQPPIERICRSCGGKHVGRCPFNSCNDKE